VEYYNSTTPPEYELQNIKAPIYLYHGAEDLLISRLVRRMKPSRNYLIKIPFP
jgi:hypothetical protein